MVLIWIFCDILQASDPPLQLDPITVTPSKFTVRSGATSAQSLSKAEIQSFPLVDNDIMRAAQIFPGVVSHDYSARFNIRGGERDEVLVRLDGMELPDPFHLQDFGGAISIIDLGLVRQLDLLMGGFPAKYGDKMSSVIDIITDSGNSKQISTKVGVDLINAHAQINGPIGDTGSWLLSGRRGYFDLLLDLMKAEEVPRPTYVDVFGKLLFQPTTKDGVTINAISALDKNRMTVEKAGVNLTSRYTNNLVWGKWRRDYTQHFWSEGYLFAGSVFHNRHYSDTTGQDIKDFGFWGTKVETTYVQTDYFGVSHQLAMGMEWRWTQSVYDYFMLQPIHPRQTIKTNGWDLKGYLQDEWQVFPNLAVNVGGRYLYQNYRQGARRFDLSPRLGLAFRLRPSMVLRIAWGRYHQPIDLMSIPIEAGVTKAGASEVATHYIFGVESSNISSAIGSLSLKAELYLKDFDHLVGEVQDFGRKSQMLMYPNQGAAFGGDVFISYLISNRLTTSLGYAYGHAQAEVNGMPYDRDYDQRHSVTANLNWRIKDGLHLNTSWRFHSGLPYTEIHPESVFEQGRLIDCRASYGKVNALRLPDYQSLDLRLTRSKRYRKLSLNWYVQILNLYNHPNVHEYALDKARDPKTDQLINCDTRAEPLFPILPMLGIEAAF